MKQDQNHANREETRRDFLKRVSQGGAFCLAASLGGCTLPENRKTASGPGRKRPNVVVVVSDDHRWNLMGCNGDPYSELRYGPYRPFKGYVNGVLYKNVSIPNHPASAFNPPLPDRQNLIVLEMPSDSPDFRHLRLYCRQGSVTLPGRDEERDFRL